jgi:excisionase family DNA binding protein
MKDKVLLSVNEACEYLSLSKSTLDNWRYEKVKLPFYKEGHKVFYDKADLDKYLESKELKKVSISE